MCANVKGILNGIETLKDLCLFLILASSLCLIMPCCLKNFLFCIAQGPSYYPCSYPSMPKEDILEAQILYKLTMELASILEVRGLFHDAPELD